MPVSKVNTSSRNWEEVSLSSIATALDDLRNFYWFVGLCEGEGHFYISPAKGAPRISIKMSDEAIIARIAAMCDVSYWSPKQVGTNKPLYRVDVQGRRALRLMKRMAPHMSPRRQAKIRAVIQAYMVDREPTPSDEPSDPLQTKPFSIVISRNTLHQPSE